jgi:2Fe-2S ferredoxin
MVESMAKITYTEFNGREHTVDVPLGWSVMEGAKKNDIPGIDADCGGGASCGTCHVYVDPTWTQRVGGRNPLEDAIIEVAENVKNNSRLACQIKVTAELDGLIVHTPKSQR